MDIPSSLYDMERFHPGTTHPSDFIIKRCMSGETGGKMVFTCPLYTREASFP